MAKFNVWITALSSSYVDILIGRLVRRNYRVEPCSLLVLEQADRPACVIALTVDRARVHSTHPKEGEPAELDAATLRSEVADVLEQIKTYYYSIVVAGHDGSCGWRLGNLDMKKIDEDRNQRLLDDIKKVN